MELLLHIWWTALLMSCLHHWHKWLLFIIKWIRGGAKWADDATLKWQNPSQESLGSNIDLSDDLPEAFLLLTSRVYALQLWLEKLDAGLFQEEFLCCSSFRDNLELLLEGEWSGPDFSVVNYNRKGRYTNNWGITLLFLWSRLDVESFLLSYWHNVPKGV